MGSVAVDSKGNVFVGDKGLFENAQIPSGEEQIVEFSPEGAQLAVIPLPSSVGPPLSLAVDSAGDLFVMSYSGRSVYRFDANASGEIEPGTEPEQIAVPVDGNPGYSVAVDMSSDSLYVASRNYVDQYSASCTPEGVGQAKHCKQEGRFGVASAPFEEANVVVNSKTGRVYVSVRNSPAKVFVFGPTVIVPDAVTGEATDIAGTSATLNATVNPLGIELDECNFEWGLTVAYGHTVPCTESLGEIGSGSVAKPVHAAISGLGLGNEYHFRIAASNENGPAESEDMTFTTLGPQVHAESFAEVTDTSVKLEGLINPNNEATSYVFEYVSAKDFAESGYAKAKRVPEGGEEIGAGSEDVAVAQDVGGLSPSTAYVFRLAATNATGTAQGPDRTFATYAAPPASQFALTTPSASALARASPTAAPMSRRRRSTRTVSLPPADPWASSRPRPTAVGSPMPPVGGSQAPKVPSSSPTTSPAEARTGQRRGSCHRQALARTPRCGAGAKTSPRSTCSRRVRLWLPLTCWHAKAPPARCERSPPMSKRGKLMPFCTRRPLITARYSSLRAAFGCRKPVDRRKGSIPTCGTRPAAN